MSARKKKPGKVTVQLSEPMQRCMSILKHLQEKPEAQPFLEPVDWEFYNLMDYPEVIKKPMDLGTIQTCIETGKYPNIDKFASDVRLVWKNAMLYNQPGSEIYTTAEKLSKAFERKMAKLKQSKKTSKKGGAAKEATRGDRVKFSELVNELSGEQLAEVVEMIQKYCPDALTEVDEEELEIEINALDSNTLFELNTYAQESINGSAAGKKRKR
eukprot:gb/GEZN01017297.1/.p1 GENE.gb/GEZN01017297.1/~~gb/GEZN01017297.1/.p1  ORF type:complete len:213 (+),score=41.69 gb/GEZN01017297.1/:38-676(+)